jgi:intracellular sulfur oxidation DsrE/DsrF family protein
MSPVRSVSLASLTFLLWAHGASVSPGQEGIPSVLPQYPSQDGSATRLKKTRTVKHHKKASVKPAVSRTVNATAAVQQPEKKHRLAVQVNVNDPAAMNLALNNVNNVEEYYRSRLEDVEIEIVAYGPGLHMLREDTSPVKERIKSISQTSRNVTFIACGNTRQNMQKAEGKEVPLVSYAHVVDSGVVRLMELQEKGWSYIRP